MTGGGGGGPTLLPLSDSLMSELSPAPGFRKLESPPPATLDMKELNKKAQAGAHQDGAPSCSAGPGLRLSA